MCGIFFSLSQSQFIAPGSSTEQLLRNRGPDYLGKWQTSIPVTTDSHETSSPRLFGTFVSTVLALRGTNLVEQPLREEQSGSVLCWNGEAWSIAGLAVQGNDSKAVFESLLASCASNIDAPRHSVIKRVVDIFASIRGPYAFIFYDATNHYLFYGRDCLGRRSLLAKSSSDGELILSSVYDNATGDEWAEVDANGIYMLDVDAARGQSPLNATHIPQRHHADELADTMCIESPFPIMNRAHVTDASNSPFDAMHRLCASLQKSLELRVQHVREADNIADPYHSNVESRIAILFSGGLDCTILARLAHEILPSGQTIDLLNVAFENPRIHSNLGPNESPYELCPDRITGRSSFAELQQVCPGRPWRFVEVNIPYSQTLAHRAMVMTLMHPHNTEMDLSISYALFFASKGIGDVRDSIGTKMTYNSRAHVLLSGLGADELFGGYQRHALAFSRQGYQGLIEELELDFNRLGKRNLGRDDRVISDSGREVRFPYLDEDFITFALQLPVHAKCDFGSPQLEVSSDPSRFLEPGKRILRLLAWELGMKRVAAEKKRAIQFGARTAKMETGKTKGTQVLT